MTEESDDPPGCPEDCDGPDLSNLPKAMKALAAACRLVKAGKLPSERAGIYVNGLTSLIKAYQDRRDSIWTSRVSKMWEAHKAETPSANPEANH